MASGATNTISFSIQFLDVHTFHTSQPSFATFARPAPTSPPPLPASLSPSMATPTPAAAAPAAASPASKNAPHLHSVASSLRSCLDGMLPDNLRNDAAAFHQHLDQQKNRVQTEKNSWRFGLNYLFETLKQHKDWYARNQQFVQLKKDVKRFDAHLATVRGILSESVSKLDLEAGLRGAELEGRVGAYRVMFEVTKIVSKLSRPLVKLQILKPNETSLSIYCDTFVLDIALSGGDGDVESASLTTVKDEQSNQFPDRDEDLLQSLKLLAGGDSSSFTEKLVRLINRAELAVKFPSLNFEQLEEQLYTTVTEACTQQSCWTVKRAVEGVTIHFKNSLHCVPISEPPRKRGRVEDPQVAGSGTGISNASDDTTDNEDMMNGVDRNGMGDGSNESAITSSDAPRATPLSGGEWSGSVSFIEWRGEVALQVAGCTPVVMVGLQARRLALAIMRKRGVAGDDLGTASADSNEDEKLFNEFVSWTDPEGHKPISPHLHFARDQSLCTVLPPRSHLPMRLEFSLTTKEISGGLRLASFPIPLSHLSTPTIAEVLQICGHSMFFHSLLLSAFSTKNNLFGERIPADSETAVNARIKVDVAAPDRVTLNAGEVLGPGKQVLIEFTTKADCVLAMSVKYLSGSPSEHSTPHPPLENEETIAKLVASCHSIPLLTYYSLKRPLLTLHGQVGSVATGGATSGEDCNGIAAVDDDLGVTMKMEGEDMLLDEMSMF